MLISNFQANHYHRKECVDKNISEQNCKKWWYFDKDNKFLYGYSHPDYINNAFDINIKSATLFGKNLENLRLKLEANYGFQYYDYPSGNLVKNYNSDLLIQSTLNDDLNCAASVEDKIRFVHGDKKEYNLIFKDCDLNQNFPFKLTIVSSSTNNYLNRSVSHLNLNNSTKRKIVIDENNLRQNIFLPIEYAKNKYEGINLNFEFNPLNFDKNGLISWIFKLNIDKGKWDISIDNDLKIKVNSKNFNFEEFPISHIKNNNDYYFYPSGNFYYNGSKNTIEKGNSNIYNSFKNKIPLPFNINEDNNLEYSINFNYKKNFNLEIVHKYKLKLQNTNLYISYIQNKDFAFEARNKHEFQINVDELKSLIANNSLNRENLIKWKI